MTEYARDNTLCYVLFLSIFLFSGRLREHLEGGPLLLPLDAEALQDPPVPLSPGQSTLLTAQSFFLKKNLLLCAKKPAKIGVFSH